MTEADGDLPAELRFRPPGRHLYGQGLALSALIGGAALLGWVEVLSGGRPYHRLGGALDAAIVATVVVFTLGAVLFLGLLLGGTVRTWRRWRRLRPPAVTINAAGFRFESRRRPLAVAWTDVERLVVRRHTYRARPSGSLLSLYVTPSTAPLQEQRPQIPASRRLAVGDLRDAGVPGEVALRFLERAAGSRLEVREHELSRD